VAGARTLAFLDTGSTTTVGNMALMEQAIRKRRTSATGPTSSCRA
jgi:hypothetical protein